MWVLSFYQLCLNVPNCALWTPWLIIFLLLHNFNFCHLWLMCQTRPSPDVSKMKHFKTVPKCVKNETKQDRPQTCHLSHKIIRNQQKNTKSFTKYAKSKHFVFYIRNLIYILFSNLLIFQFLLSLNQLFQ